MNAKAMMTLVALLLCTVQNVWAESVTFNVRSWNSETKQVETTLDTKDATVLEGDHADDWIGLSNGYYVVKTNTKYKVLNILGNDIHLILANGATLECVHVKLESNYKLHIHSDRDIYSGSLKVTNIQWTYQQSTSTVGASPGSSSLKGVYDTAAGIGGGNHADMGSLYVHGGRILVENISNGAAIGGGKYGKIAGEVVIYYGWVRAINLGGWASGFHGAGIGGGYKADQGGPVYIYGGTVEAAGSDDSNHAWTDESSAIGVHDDGALGTIVLSDNLKVEAGSVTTSNQNTDYTPQPERVFTTSERVAACQWRLWAMISKCEHIAQNGDADDIVTTYTIDDDQYHTRHCRYCATTWKEEHSAGETCVCGHVNKANFTVYEPGSTKNTYEKGETVTVGQGKQFTLPSCSNVPAGYKFEGWQKDPATVGGWVADKSDDFIQPKDAVTAEVGMSDVKFYPRFSYIFNIEWMWDESNPVNLTSVRVTHPDLTTMSKAATVTSEDIKDVNNEIIGTRYQGTVTFTQNGYSYTYSDVKEIYNATSITLSDNASNDATLASYTNSYAHVKLDGRTLWKDGSWNTLCLPFDLSEDQKKASPIAQAEVRTLASSDYDASTGTLTLTFTDPLSSLSAGVPYIVRWDKGYENDTNPQFIEVTISTITGSSVGSQYVDFEGSFSPVNLMANDKTVLYLGAENKLYYPSATMNVGSCRAVFRLHNGLTAGDKAEARAFVLNFGDDESTGILSTTNLTNYTNSDGAWYDLSGRKIANGKLNGKLPKGIYINNGKKVVIK